MATEPSVAELLGRLRAQGLTNAEIARRLERSPSFVSKVLTGRRPGESLRASAQELLGGKGAAPAPRRRRKSGALARVRAGRRTGARSRLPSPAGPPPGPPRPPLRVAGEWPRPGRPLTVYFTGAVQISADRRQLRRMPARMSRELGREFLAALEADDAQAAGELLWAAAANVDPRAMRAFGGGVSFDASDFEVEIHER